MLKGYGFALVCATLSDLYIPHFLFCSTHLRLDQPQWPVGDAAKHNEAHVEGNKESHPRQAKRGYLIQP